MCGCDEVITRRKTGQARDIDPCCRQISVAIPFYNRSQFIDETLENLLEDNRVSEIIISDDCSNRKEYKNLKSKVAPHRAKIKLFRNRCNWGPLKNKYLAISRCTGERAILLDSDNSLTKNYIDKLYEIKYWEPNVIYCPDYARPSFCYKEYVGGIIDIEKAKEILTDRKKAKQFRKLLNTGNYFVDVKNYVTSMEEHKDISAYHGDVIITNYFWLRRGFALKIVEGLEYEHRMHDGSNMNVWSDTNLNTIREVKNSIIKGSNYKPRYNGIVWKTIFCIAAQLGLSAVSVKKIKYRLDNLNRS